jgi:cytochrome c biogenesis protein CcdA
MTIVIVMIHIDLEIYIYKILWRKYDREKMSYLKYLKFMIIFMTIALVFIVITFLPLIIAEIISEKLRNNWLIYIGVIAEILWIPLIIKMIDYIWEKT